MGRRIFISYEGSDRDQAKGFNLLRWNRNVDLDFVGRHLLDPVDSKDEAYIASIIKEQIKGTSATVVLLGKQTHNSEWVEKEIEWSLEKGNGVLGIRLEQGVQIPQSLRDAGAEVIDWTPKFFESAIERAIRQTRRVRELETARATRGGSCAR